MSDSEVSSFKTVIANTIHKSLSNVFANKALFCVAKTQYHPLVITGPSGAGKSTLYNMLLERNPNLFELSVSCTTRKPRQGEVHGKNYYFMNMEEFTENINKDLFAEYCLVHTNYYGTLTNQVLSFIQKGKICILDIDVQGAEKIHKKFPNWNYVFLSAPSKEILEKRLRGRATETEQQLQIRLKNSDMEIELKNKLGFFYEIVNESKDKAYSDILSYLKNKYSSIHLN